MTTRVVRPTMPVRFSAEPGAAENATVEPRGFSRRLRSAGTWVVASRILGVGVTTLVNMALARWLSPEDFGSFLLLLSVLSFLSILATLGLNAAVVRFVAESLGRGDVARAERSLRLVFLTSVISVTSVAGLAALVMAAFDASLLGLPRVAGLVPWAVTALVLLAFLQLAAECCRGLHAIGLASLFSGGQSGGLLSNLFFLVLIAAAVVVGKPSFLTALVLNAHSMAVCLPLAIFALARVARGQLSEPASERVEPAGPALNELLRFSLSMLVIQVTIFATMQADLWLAGIWCPHDQLALYGSARRLVLLVSLPIQMLNLTVMASIAELYSQNRLRDLQRLLRRAATFAALPSLAAIVILIALGGPILELMFGAFFRQAALPLSILGIGQMVLVSVGSCGGALEMSGNQTASLVVNFAAAVALLLFGSLAARQFGIVGLAAASSGVIAMQSLALWLLARRLAGVWTHPTFRPLATAG